MMRMLDAPLLEMRKRSLFSTLVLFVWTLLLSCVAAQLPYNPTHVLQDGTDLYVFRPQAGSSPQFALEHIDISNHIDASETPHTILSSELPFLPSDKRKAFTPVIDGGGNITVYTGDCGSKNGEIWTYGYGTLDKSKTKSWWKEQVVVDKDNGDTTSIGPRHLNGGIAFSSVVDSNITDTSVYVFGGMCPNGAGGDNWQANAQYSNSMVLLDPFASDQPLQYRLSLSSSRGPPIAEAGFTLTGLVPSYSNRSNGSQTRQQNFVLIGGHTGSAFINMSQVALFALPQQSWTFIPVQQPDTKSTELAIRKDVTEVEPRSGHTAVLTPDGQHLVVYGGWIGDTNTPALPQLAVLNVGEGFGGVGAWQWTVPATSGNGLSTDSGLYGHGAAMLPGGVMMITGGYAINAPSSRRRRDSPVSGKTLFFNVSSYTWITDYTPPKDVLAAPSKSGPLSTTSQKAGLGVGIAIGMAAVLSLFVFYLWYTRRLRKQREIREKQIQELSLAAHRYTLDNMSPGPTGNYYDDAHDGYFSPTNGHQNGRGWRNLNAHDAERTGLLVEIPSPTRGLRRSLGNRPTHLMNRYDDRRVHGSGHIHVIDELEEEQEEEQGEQNHPQEQDQDQSHASENTPLHPSEMSERTGSKGFSIFANAPVLDPFVTSKRGSRMDVEQSAPLIHSTPTAPEQEQPHQRTTEWLSAHDAGLVRRSSQHSAGRVSPDKSDRTESTLSERSMLSNLSSTGSIARTASMRSSAILNCTNPFRTPDGSPPNSRSNRHSGGWESCDERSQSLTSTRSGFPSAAEERDSFTTAPTSFIQLQAEGQSLLGGNPERARPGTGSSSGASYSHARPGSETPMSWAGTAATSLTAPSQLDWPNQTRKRRWMGSVRKALARSSTTGPSSRTRSMTTSTPQLERYRDDPQSALDLQQPANRSSYPSSSSSPPRRAASDATFWRRSKSSKRDWMDDQLDPMDPRSIWRRNSGDDFGAPEDAALAERARQKQEWRKQSTLIDLLDDSERLPTPRTPIQVGDLGDARSAHTVGTEEEDWDVEAAVERRVVQVTFTAPRGKLRVVNADVDRSSVLSLPREEEGASKVGAVSAGGNGNSPSSTATGSPGSSRVKDLVGRFEGVVAARSSPPAGKSSSPSSSPPRPVAKTGQEFLLSPYAVSRSPSPSPSPSISSLKVRAKGSSRSLAKKPSKETAGMGGAAGRLCSKDITTLRDGE